MDQGWDVARRRQLYERALSVAGLHFTDGRKIWAAYRAFELSQLETATKAGAGVGAAEDTVRVGASIHCPPRHPTHCEDLKRHILR